MENCISRIEMPRDTLTILVPPPSLPISSPLPFPLPLLFHCPFHTSQDLPSAKGISPCLVTTPFDRMPSTPLPPGVPGVDGIAGLPVSYGSHEYITDGPRRILARLTMDLRCPMDSLMPSFIAPLFTWRQVSHTEGYECPDLLSLFTKL